MPIYTHTHMETQRHLLSLHKEVASNLKTRTSSSSCDLSNSVVVYVWCCGSIIIMILLHTTNLDHQTAFPCLPLPIVLLSFQLS